MSKLWQRLQREQFFPSSLGMFVNPFFLARRALCTHIKAFSPEINGIILDIGCGRKPYQKLFSYSQYIGLEIDTEHSRCTAQADLYYDGDRFPVETSSIDSVVCFQVLEHVFEPDAFLREIHRVLKPSGHLLLTVPFVWNEHEKPRDYARYSSFGLEYLLKRNGFTVIKQRKSLSDCRLFFQLINVALSRVFSPDNRWTLFLLTLFSIPCNILGRILYRLLPDNEDLYLDNIVLALKSQPG